jgi:5-methylthioribose kinase
LPNSDQIETVDPIPGGVSSDVFLVKLQGEAICVKFAVEQLRVEADWHASLQRSEAEYRWLMFVQERFPNSVPATFGYGAGSSGIAMEYLPAELYPNWKTELLGGAIDRGFAKQVGERLAGIHAASAAQPGLRERFANQADFEALRLEPYIRFTAARYPALAPRLNRLADDLAAARIALVHGDVSPKNILCGPKGPVFIDAECAVFGDPAFDAAFCLNHLLIKAIHMREHAAALQGAAQALWRGYSAGIDWEDPAEVEARLAGLLPALMLARVDGKSPLEYLSDAAAQKVRERALQLLSRPEDSAAPLADMLDPDR